MTFSYTLTFAGHANVVLIHVGAASIIPLPIVIVHLDAVLTVPVDTVGLPYLPVFEVQGGLICPAEAPIPGPHQPDPGAVHGFRPDRQEVRLGLGVDTGQVTVVTVRSNLL